VTNPQAAHAAGQAAGALGGLGVVLALALAAFFAYMLPAFIAWRRGHRDVLAIGAVNFIFGWTFIGWAAALIWSLTGNVRKGNVTQ
jgi:hypothetical protein